MPNKELEEAAANFVKSEETKKAKTLKGAVEDLGNIEDRDDDAMVKKEIQHEEPKSQMDIGWQRVDVRELPSEGMFYDNGIQILMRAATGKEIKHWASLNEQDGVQLDNMINYMVEKHFTVSIPGKRASFKDLLDLDRIYLIFALNEYTFKNGENKVKAEVQLDSGEIETVHVTKNTISLFKMPEKLERFYDPETKSLKFELDGETIYMNLPTIGTSKFFYDLRERKRQEGKELDTDFLRAALFMVKDWRGLNEQTYNQMAAQSNGWSLRKHSLITKVVDSLTAAIQPQMTVMTSAGEVTRPLNFQGGFKSLFLIPDILDELD